MLLRKTSLTRVRRGKAGRCRYRKEEMAQLVGRCFGPTVSATARVSLFSGRITIADRERKEQPKCRFDADNVIFSRVGVDGQIVRKVRYGGKFQRPPDSAAVVEKGVMPGVYPGKRPAQRRGLGSRNQSVEIRAFSVRNDTALWPRRAQSYARADTVDAIGSANYARLAVPTAFVTQLAALRYQWLSSGVW